jgi:hypothetical protein
MELLPGGFDGPDNQLLGELLFDNDVWGTLTTRGNRGTYRCRIFKKRRGGRKRQVIVRDYPRLAYHPWELVRRALNIAKEEGKL